MLEPRASRTATAFLSVRHVIDASCKSPSGIGDAKQIAILGGLTLAWLAVDGSVRPKVALSAPTSPRNTAPAESRELVDRLLSQVEALKSEVRELMEAQQQPAHAIAAIEAEQESRNRVPPVYWYPEPRCAVVRARERT